MASLIEAIEVTDAEEAGESNNVCGTYSGSTVDRTCYQSRTWTLPQSLSGITRVMLLFNLMIEIIRILVLEFIQQVMQKQVNLLFNLEQR